jgi:hypothetical protein
VEVVEDGCGLTVRHVFADGRSRVEVTRDHRSVMRLDRLTTTIRGHGLYSMILVGTWIVYLTIMIDDTKAIDRMIPQIVHSTRAIIQAKALDAGLN